MNMFVLDNDPTVAAKLQLDKHVVKMILETAQLLCGAHWVTESPYEIPYKLSHKNHPCSIWARESLVNYLYLCEIGLELCKEYTYRYGKRHKSQQIIEWCLINKPNISDVGFSKPPKAMPDEYKVAGNSIQSYKNYYLGDKQRMFSWKNRPQPSWIV